MTYVESINNSLHQMLGNDPNIIMIGEDLLDPYGGAFKVSKGLSVKYPNQIISTPISEQAIIGSAIGMSMCNIKPIVEIMFGDFLTLCVDQIVNHATKYNWMYNGQISIPIVIRTPMGGGRGYGPTHSQSLESMFMSISGLSIISPSIFHNPGEMLAKCVIHEEHPCLFIEHKASYPKDLVTGGRYKDFCIQKITSKSNYEDILLSLYPNEKSDILIITYGSMSELAVESARQVFLNDEILVDILVVGSVRPLNKELIVSHARKIGRILVLEEGNKVGGWGAEVSSVIHEKIFTSLESPVQRIGAMDCSIPSCMPMESEVLPTVEKIRKMIKKLLGIF
jgi:pyruvate/2-oxoglutarate/acetoin dehydrogenase E1 component